ARTASERMGMAWHRGARGFNSVLCSYSLFRKGAGQECPAYRNVGRTFLSGLVCVGRTFLSGLGNRLSVCLGDLDVVLLVSFGDLVLQARFVEVFVLIIDQDRVSRFGSLRGGWRARGQSFH